MEIIIGVAAGVAVGVVVAMGIIGIMKIMVQNIIIMKVGGYNNINLNI